MKHCHTEMKEYEKNTYYCPDCNKIIILKMQEYDVVNLALKQLKILESKREWISDHREKVKNNSEDQEADRLEHELEDRQKQLDTTTIIPQKKIRHYKRSLENRFGHGRGYETAQERYDFLKRLYTDNPQIDFLTAAKQIKDRFMIIMSKTTFEKWMSQIMDEVVKTNTTLLVSKDPTPEQEFTTLLSTPTPKKDSEYWIQKAKEKGMI